jgi:hypothetical protein
VRSGLIDVGSAEVLSACVRGGCVLTRQTRALLFLSFAKFLWERRGALKQLRGAAESFVLKFSKG